MFFDSKASPFCQNKYFLRKKCNQTNHSSLIHEAFKKIIYITAITAGVVSSVDASQKPRD